jgi:hypothetical protein
MGIIDGSWISKITHASIIKKKKEEEASGEQGLRWREKGRLRAGALMAALT